MDRNTLVAQLKTLGADPKSIKSAADVRTFLKTLDFDDLYDPQTKGVVDIDKAWKTVYVTADAGESVEIVAPPEGAMADMEDDEEEVMPKRKPVTARDVQKGFAASAPVRSTSTKDLGLAARKKSYDRATNGNGTVRGGRPVFNSADEAEAFGAAFRLATAQKAYPMQSRDREIIGLKAGSTLDNNFAGALVVHQTAPQIIDLLHEFGAVRQLAGVTTMPDGEYRIPRKTANMQFSFVPENGTIGQTNPTFDMVQLVANKLAGICTVSNELLNDEAFNIADQVARASVAGANYAEDMAYFFGTGLGNAIGVAGLLPQSDTDATFDATLSSNWGDYTIDKLQNWLAKIPIEAWRSGTVKIACSSAFYYAVLRRFALSAGGNLGGSIIDGVGGGFNWDGIPVVLTEVLPSTYGANQLVAVAGSFERGTKFGEVSGSQQLEGSDQAYWALDQYAWRFKERIAYNFHDVGGVGSELIGLID